MTPYNDDVMQALKWMQNNAPKIQGLLQKKAQWYRTYNANFWDNWYQTDFNIKTASPFGLQVWCIILGLPSSKFGLYPIDSAWAYGAERENYVWSGATPPPSDANTVGGNFYGGSDSTLLNLDEVRYALMLRYAALVGNGRTEYVNRMLQWIFNEGESWDYANKIYAYVADSTLQESDITGETIFIKDSTGYYSLSSSPRTNYIPDANNWGNNAAGWNGNSAITGVVANSAIAPDGTMTACTMTRKVAAPGNTWVACNRSDVSFAGKTVTFSTWLKNGTFTQRFVFFIRDMADTNWGYCEFDLVAGKAYPAGGTNAAIQQYPNGWYRVALTATFGPNAPAGYQAIVDPRDEMDPPGTVNDTYFGWGAQVETNPYASYLIKSSGTSFKTQTDYVLNKSTGSVTMGFVPENAAVLSWTGSWRSVAVTDPQQFGTGDGTTTVFQIPPPAPAAQPISGAFQVEYRFGAGLNLSAQFINLLNDTQSTYGILPSFAGSKVTAIQET